ALTAPTVRPTISAVEISNSGDKVRLTVEVTVGETFLDKFLHRYYGARPELRDQERQHVITDAVSGRMHGSRPEREAIEYLEASKLPVLDVVIHQKSVIPETLISGQTVFEISGLTDAEQRAVDEFQAVWSHVKDKFSLKQRVTA
ncbi:hypothetical protein ABS771_28480, partial [Methylobacterium brachiatum]